MNCPLCKGKSLVCGKNDIFGKKLGVMKCSLCGLYFLALPRDKHFIKEYYSQEYWDEFSKRGMMRNYADKVVELASKILGLHSLLSKNYHSMIKKYGKKHFRQTKMLEIGCNKGRLLEYFSKQGILCDGIEPDKKNSLIAAKKVSGRVYCTDIESFKPKKKYDLIVMIHVLEHNIDPLRVLAKLHALLEPNGEIFIVVPDGQNKALFNEIVYENPHIFTYNIKNFKNMISRAGFGILFANRINPYLNPKSHPLNANQYEDYSEICVYARKK